MEAMMESRVPVSAYKYRLVLKKGNQHVNLRVTEIVYFFTENKVSFAVDRSGIKYISDKNISELIALLDPKLFFRANRKFIVNGHYIKTYQSVDRVKIRLDLDMPLIKNDIIVSQLSAPAFRKWIYSR